MIKPNSFLETKMAKPKSKTKFTKKYKAYLLRFANGEQNIEYGRINLGDNKNKETISDTIKDYYWQETEVYNLLLPFIARAEAFNCIGDDDILQAIDILIPYQKEYNNIKNRKAELLRRIANGILAVEDGSVDIDNLDTEGLSPNKILVYRQGATPPILDNKGAAELRAIQEIENETIRQFRDLESRLIHAFITKTKQS